MAFNKKQQNKVVDVSKVLSAVEKTAAMQKPTDNIPDSLSALIDAATGLGIDIKANRLRMKPLKAGKKVATVGMVFDRIVLDAGQGAKVGMPEGGVISIQGYANLDKFNAAHREEIIKVAMDNEKRASQYREARAAVSAEKLQERAQALRNALTASGMTEAKIREAVTTAFPFLDADNDDAE